MHALIRDGILDSPTLIAVDPFKYSISKHSLGSLNASSTHCGVIMHLQCTLGKKMINANLVKLKKTAPCSPNF